MKKSNKAYQWVKSILTKKEKVLPAEERHPIARVIPQIWTPCDRCTMCNPKHKYDAIDTCKCHTNGYGEQMTTMQIRGELEECPDFENKN